MEEKYNVNTKQYNLNMPTAIYSTICPEKISSLKPTHYHCIRNYTPNTSPFVSIISQLFNRSRTHYFANFLNYITTQCFNY